ncbi:hypothetical protein O1611_g7160 [Lasiodiplodia mahajangana]|uniref:Uncharacterized protein n=1 Tax=Lasiodiplodia mahajangana TaxID=1108764 RepID=A0ACC2JGP0_9PEZI|nr:hypothetical protein O1611_g7160 [Lasiodiplodia mahajangana]
MPGLPGTWTSPVEPPTSVDLDECISRLYKKELLAESVIEAICAKTKELLMRESNVVHVRAPVTVVGDIHGQFYDLIEIFKIGGWCPDTNYLFLGDYVDRGMFSVETISLLVCLKLRYPDRVHLIRGNHESRGVTQSIDQIKIIDRFREIPHEGPMADLVWSDPDPERDEFSLSPRGAGYTFGARVVKKFLAVNGMNHILRAHQLCQEGYLVLYDDHLSTVWSAPNYCYRCGNMASVLEDEGPRMGSLLTRRPRRNLALNPDFAVIDGVDPAETVEPTEEAQQVEHADEEQDLGPRLLRQLRRNLAYIYLLDAAEGVNPSETIEHTEEAQHAEHIERIEHVEHVEYVEHVEHVEHVERAEPIRHAEAPMHKKGKEQARDNEPRAFRERRTYRARQARIARRIRRENRAREARARRSY